MRKHRLMTNSLYMTRKKMSDYCSMISSDKRTKLTAQLEQNAVLTNILRLGEEAHKYKIVIGIASISDPKPLIGWSWTCRAAFVLE